MQKVFDNLTPISKEYLACKSMRDLYKVTQFWSDVSFYAARYYLRECPISELSKYINHPSKSVQHILEQRFQKLS